MLLKKKVKMRYARFSMHFSVNFKAKLMGGLIWEHDRKIENQIRSIGKKKTKFRMRHKTKDQIGIYLS